MTDDILKIARECGLLPDAYVEDIEKFAATLIAMGREKGIDEAYEATLDVADSEMTAQFGADTKEGATVHGYASGVLALHANAIRRLKEDKVIE